MKHYHTVIIGGGAAGLAAACAAGQSKSVLVIEKNERVGRKLLATGNGRCNLTNTDVSAAYYHSHTPKAVQQILSARSYAATLAFFNDLGLSLCEDEGRIYPYSRQASAVLDLLRLRTEACGVDFLTGAGVTRIRQAAKQNSFIIELSDSEMITSHTVVIATGGKAAPATGSDGDGFKFLAALGHTIHTPYPALVPLTARHPFLKALKGVRVRPAALTLTENDFVLARETGELLFTEYGLSGIPAMQVSGALHEREQVMARIDLFPDKPQSELRDILFQRRSQLGKYPAPHMFTGLLHKALGCAILNTINANYQSLAMTQITDKQMNSLVSFLKDWVMPITGTTGFVNAQTTGGGADLSQFDPLTLMSKKIPGLFAAGEVLDAYGDCGGYNLHWAWTTGFLAGYNAFIYG